MSADIGQTAVERVSRGRGRVIGLLVGLGAIVALVLAADVSPLVALVPGLVLGKAAATFAAGQVRLAVAGTAGTVVGVVAIVVLDEMQTGVIGFVIGIALGVVTYKVIAGGGPKLPEGAV